MIAGLVEAFHAQDVERLADGWREDIVIRFRGPSRRSGARPRPKQWLAARFARQKDYKPGQELPGPDRRHYRSTMWTGSVDRRPDRPRDARQGHGVPDHGSTARSLCGRGCSMPGPRARRARCPSPKPDFWPYAFLGTDAAAPQGDSAMSAADIHQQKAASGSPWRGQRNPQS